MFGAMEGPVNSARLYQEPEVEPITTQPLLDPAGHSNQSSVSSVDSFPDRSESLFRESLGYTVYYSTQLKWVVLYAVLTLLLALASSASFVISIWTSSSPTYRASVILGFAPVTSLLFLLGFPVLTQHFSAWMNHMPFHMWRIFVVPMVLALSYLLAGAFILQFDPAAILFLICLGVLTAGCLQELQASARDFSWVDASVWLLLWLPLHLSWVQWSGYPKLDFQWWSITISVLIIVCWGCIRPVVHIGFTFIPNLKDVVIFAITTLALVLVIIPITLLTSLISWEPTMSPATIFLVWVQDLVSTSITEELLFRGVLLTALMKITQRHSIALAVSSIIYGFSYWNTESVLLYQFYFFLYAFASGSLFGLAFIKSGKILPGFLAHSILDTIVVVFVKLPTPAPQQLTTLWTLL